MIVEISAVSGIRIDLIVCVGHHQIFGALPKDGESSLCQLPLCYCQDSTVLRNPEDSFRTMIVRVEITLVPVLPNNG